MGLDITNVVNVSVSTPPAGLAPVNVNNLLCVTDDTPVVSLGTNKFKVYTNPTDVGTDWGTTSKSYAAAQAVFSQSPNIRTGGGVFIVAPLLGGTAPSEDLDDAAARLKPLVYFGGIASAFTSATEDLPGTATWAQSERKLYFAGSTGTTDFDGATGAFAAVQSATQTQTRCLYHGSTGAGALAAYKWGYAGRAMSTNFEGSNTTQTMALKQIANVIGDETVDSTVYGKAQTYGVDVYPNIAGRASLQSFGANWFFDDIYNLGWFIAALEVAGFNALATTSTKLPQTEAGMDFLKGAYRKVCQQAVTNRFAAPGAWNSADTFGNPEDFIRNIAEEGFYIYSAPISSQSAAVRATRAAPLVQVALKFAGALHTSSVIVNINA